MKVNPGSDLKVFISNRDSRCDECGEDLGHHAWITLVGEGRTLCLSCADLDHLVFLWVPKTHRWSDQGDADPMGVASTTVKVAGAEHLAGAKRGGWE